MQGALAIGGGAFPAFVASTAVANERSLDSVDCGVRRYDARVLAVALIMFMLAGCSDGAGSGTDAHFTARRETMEVDVVGSDEPAETVAVFVLEADPGWRIVDHDAQLRSNPSAGPRWTMFRLRPESGMPGTVVRGTPSIEFQGRPILMRLTVRVPPTKGSNVLCTSLAPAATEGRGTQEGVPDRLHCVPIPGR